MNCPECMMYVHTAEITLQNEVRIEFGFCEHCGIEVRKYHNDRRIEFHRPHLMGDMI